MEFTYNRIDVPPYSGSQTPPHDVIAKAAGEIWMIPHSPVQLGEPIDWRHHRKKEYVYVPLFPYITPADPELALAFTLQLGLRIASDLDTQIKRIHLAIGHPVNEVFNQQTGGVAWQYQVGVAVRIK